MLIRALLARAARTAARASPLLQRSCAAPLTTGANDGWIFGHVLDGRGGSVPIVPWDVTAVRRARVGTGAWVHLDFRAAPSRDFIAACARTRGKWVAGLMVEDPRMTQPRCEVASNWAGMLLTLRVACSEHGEDMAPAEQEVNIFPFRMWLGRGILITARGLQPADGAFRLPVLDKSLRDGHGPHTCGGLAAAAISDITTLTANSVMKLEDSMFALKARLQQQALEAGGHRPVSTSRLQALRRELMPLRYTAISMRRYEMPELNALQTVVRLTKRPEQTLFADGDMYEVCARHHQHQHTAHRTPHTAHRTPHTAHHTPHTAPHTS
jgi:hypothetical protein